jgi:hypothetical protein
LNGYGKNSLFNLKYIIGFSSSKIVFFSSKRNKGNWLETDSMTKSSEKRMICWVGIGFNGFFSDEAQILPPEYRLGFYQWKL